MTTAMIITGFGVHSQDTRQQIGILNWENYEYLMFLHFHFHNFKSRILFLNYTTEETQTRVRNWENKN